MNRYPWWKYLIMALALVVGLLYTLPNFFGEAPAVQVSSGKSTLKIGSDTAARVEQVLKTAGITPDFVQFEPNAAGSGTVKARLADTDAQLKAKDTLGKEFNPDPANPDYIVALNLLSRSPHLAHAPARAADVPGPGPARWRALSDAGGHGGGADAAHGSHGRRRPHPAARQEPAPRRHLAARTTSVDRALPRCRRRQCGARRAEQTAWPTCSGSTAPDRQRRPCSRARSSPKRPNASRSRRSSRTSPRCTTGSTSWACPSR